MSKITLKQIQAVCTELNNGLLKKTFWGIFADRKLDTIVLFRQARRPEKRSEEGVVFEGNPKECMAYLAAVKDWTPVPVLANIGEEE